MPKILFFFLLFFSQISFANELEGTYLPDPNYVTYNTIDGLSNSIVTAITQDLNGIMWFGTEEGLNRFDGNKFVTYRYAGSKNNALSGIRITALHIDKFNNLWIGTASGGLNLYRRETDDFLNFSIKNSRLTDNSITTIVSDDDHVWIGTTKGLNKLSLKTNEITLVELLTKKNKTNSTLSISALIKTAKDTLWVGTKSGLLKYNFINNTNDFFTKENSKLSSNLVTNLYFDSNNDLWVATEFGLNKFTLNCSCFKAYLSIPNNKNTIPNNFVIAITESKDGTLWIGTNRGTATYNRQANIFNRFRLLQEHEMGNIVRDIRSAYTSSDGTVWLGSFQMDLISIPVTAFNFQTYHYSIDSSGLKSDDINSIYAEKDFMITGAVGGLYKYGINEQGKILNTSKLLDTFALSIKKFRDNSYWFATNTGLFHLNQSFKPII